MPSGFMSCENNVSLVVYLLPLGKSIPDNQSNIEKSRAEDGKRKSERGWVVRITMRPYLRLLVPARPEHMSTPEIFSYVSHQLLFFVLFFFFFFLLNLI